jgi:hypothetical protein
LDSRGTSLHRERTLHSRRIGCEGETLKISAIEPTHLFNLQTKFINRTQYGQIMGDHPYP